MLRGALLRRVVQSMAASKARNRGAVALDSPGNPADSNTAECHAHGMAPEGEMF